MKRPVKRIVIYPKDVQLITGRSYRQSIRFLNRIKADLNKRENELLSIDEFCQYTSLKYEQVAPLILG